MLKKNKNPCVWHSLKHVTSKGSVRASQSKMKLWNCIQSMATPQQRLQPVHSRTTHLKLCIPIPVCTEKCVIMLRIFLISTC